MATKVRAERLTYKRAMVAEPPPLNSGDRLTRREFERRYSALPQIKKAELVEGEEHSAFVARLGGKAG